MKYSSKIQQGNLSIPSYPQITLGLLHFKTLQTLRDRDITDRELTMLLDVHAVGVNGVTAGLNERRWYQQN
jgi:hypothetical protein